MSFLDRILSRPAVGDKPVKSGRRVPGDETRPVQMSLEERMQLRREMMFEAVQATLLDAGLPNSSVKFKVVAADKRGHSYAVMVDLPVEFMESPHGRQRALSDLALVISDVAKTRFGLMVVGVYWRVNEELALPSEVRAAREALDLVDAMREEHAYASPEEIAAFEAALRAGGAGQVGARIYNSDLAPLEPERGSSGLR